jgi:hypothetical protein
LFASIIDKIIKPKSLITMKNFIFISILSFVVYSLNAQNQMNELYNLNTGLKPRSISFENPTGEPGKGGMAASHLGTGRKGSASRQIKPGETVVLCDIKEAGTIRHIWMTGTFTRHPFRPEWERYLMLRSTIIRAYWDGQEHPSIECPLGDFMGLAHGKVTSYESAVHSIGEEAALNFWLPMPFAKSAKITLTNDSELPFGLFYQIDYTIGDKHPDDFGRLHTLFRRENPTTLKEDFEILPKRTGKGRFLGAVLGVRTLQTAWWGEGEVKIYMDGDKDFPTICGTGAEDYVGLSYGIQQTTFNYHGANLVFQSDSVSKSIDARTNEPVEFRTNFISMYRWHIPDPINWEKECRITIQQIGFRPLFERQDDWSTATFWYEPIPSAPLPALPSRKERVADLSEVFPLPEESAGSEEQLEIGLH